MNKKIVNPDCDDAKEIEVVEAGTAEEAEAAEEIMRSWRESDFVSEWSEIVGESPQFDRVRIETRVSESGKKKQIMVFACRFKSGDCCDVEVPLYLNPILGPRPVGGLESITRKAYVKLALQKDKKLRKGPKRRGRNIRETAKADYAKIRKYFTRYLLEHPQLFRGPNPYRAAITRTAEHFKNDGIRRKTIERATFEQRKKKTRETPP